MSSHYITISCPHPACDTIEQIYTGDKTTDEFPDSAWEGEWIYTPCNDHLEWMGFKRLSDTELSAEFWKSRVELGDATSQSRHYYMFGLDPDVQHKLDEHEQRMYKVHTTIERFATTPHYDEVK